ncbi:hypothetical protein [Micromonospora arborensis]|uniref:hypothetical protein n=1 Tax=Micromonospora arborensis TaxID=2116518 RepID=UPI00370F948F
MTTYVGDAVEVTFSTTTGATVTVTWISPEGQVVTSATPVVESPSGSGNYPHVLTPTEPGMWEARFTATGAAIQTEPYYLRALALGGPPPLATIDEVIEMFRPLTEAEQGLTKALLRRASHMIRSNVPRFAQRVAAGEIDGESVGHAVINMVLRVLRNPGGLKAETTGPFARTYDTTAAVGLLVLTDTELTMVTPASPAVASPMAGTIAAGVGPSMGGWLRDRDRRYGELP